MFFFGGGGLIKTDGRDLAECVVDLAECGSDLVECGSDLVEYV